MVKLDVVLVYLNCSFNGMASLSHVNLSTLVWSAVNTWCFKSCVIIGGLEDTGDYS
jgi:hypothetical protein